MVMVLVCQWCGDKLDSVRGEPGVFVHEKDGYAICWDHHEASAQCRDNTTMRTTDDRSF